jgi:hypothetical protein
MKIGDAISTVATPIARALNLPCIDPATNQLRPESGCAKMRDNLNNGMAFTDAIYQRWFVAKQQGEKMKYQMIVVIEAEKLSEAVSKGESLGEVLSVQVRPEPMQRPPGVNLTGQPAK